MSSTTSRVRVYMACSLDGFIAGPENDLSWLHADHSASGDLEPAPDALHFEEFMSQVGALLMGRTTYDVVEGLGQWIYGETPVLVATTRALEPIAPTVQARSGDIRALVDAAKSAAGEKDVYLDGGDLIRQALDAGLVDEITATLVPILLGEGTRLFDGLVQRHRLQFVSSVAYGGGLLQVTAKVLRDA